MSGDGSDSASLATALGVSALPQCEAAAAALPGLPSSLDVPHRLSVPPLTWADAFARVTAREEAKKRKDPKKGEGRSRYGGKAGAPLAPGTRLGAEEKNAFWMMMEEHFRDVLQDDLQLLLPAYVDPRADPSFRVPALGRLQKEGGQKPVKKRRASQPRPTKPKELEGVSIMPVSYPGDQQACAICGDGDSYDDNKILFCDACDMGVHQLCYGVPVIPTGEWNCAACKHKKATGQEASCVICPVKGGALKPCSYEAGPSAPAVPMMHLFCSQWTPETYIKPENHEWMEPIDGFANIPRGRRGLACIVCKERSGACIQCSLGQCRASFHPMCARAAGLTMELVNCADRDSVEMKAYCPKHSKGRPSSCGEGDPAADPAGGPPEAEASKEGSANGDASGAAAGEARVAEEEPAVAWAPAPAPLLVQCSDAEVAMLSLAAIALAESEDAPTQLADACGLSEEETMRLVGASADSDAPRVALPPEAAAGARAWLTQHALPALKGTGASAKGARGTAHAAREASAPGAVTETTDAAAAETAAAAAPGVPAAAPQTADTVAAAPGTASTSEPAYAEAAAADPGAAATASAAAAPTGAAATTAAAAVAEGEADAGELPQPGAGPGSWGRLDLHEPLAWIMAQIMGRGLPMPDSTLSQLPALKAIAADVAGEPPEAVDEAVHPYVQMLLDAPASACALAHGGGGAGPRTPGEAPDDGDASVSPGRLQGGRSASGGINYAQMHSRGHHPEDGAASADSVLGFGGSQRKMRMSRSSSASGCADVLLTGGSPAVEAVKSCIVAGPAEGSLEQELRAQEQPDALLAAAPDDEVLGEILALQAELAQQVARNREAVGNMLGAVLADLPRQAEAAQTRRAAEVDNNRHVEMVREVKRHAKQERKQQQLREQQAILEAAAAASPRITPVALRAGAGAGAGAGARSGEPSPDGSHLGPQDLRDPLAVRRAEEDAVCAVCGDGTSVAPNMIVFCERCDLGVHQRCYGVATIPAGEWLCWPCLRHEEALEARGVPRPQIRPPRWQRKARSTLEGGSVDTPCALCPNRGGLHALHPELALLASPVGPDAVVGLPAVRPERWGQPCAVCGSTAGAVVPCATPGCPVGAHPLCARRGGLPLSVHSVGGQQVYGLHCALHAAGAARGEGFPLEVLPTGGGGQPKKHKDKAKESKAKEKEGKPKKDAPPSKAKEAKAEAKAKARAEAKAEAKAEAARVAALAEQLDTLARTRLEMEQLRLLCERVRRRERLKREGTRLLRNLAAALREGGGGAGGGVPSPEDALAALAAPFPEAPSPPAGPKRARAASPDARGGGDTKRPRPSSRRAGGLPPEAPAVKVDRECMMTAGQAEAVNDKLPKGFLYVPRTTWETAAAAAAAAAIKP
eukprot:jgi/Tetstr1/465416/TSEL_010100.t1